MHQIIRFYIRYHTHYGQEMFLLGNMPALGSDVPQQAHRLNCMNHEWWYTEVNITGGAFILRYQYLLRDLEEVKYEGAVREVTITPGLHPETVFIDTWNDAACIENAWTTAPFTRVFFNRPTSLSVDGQTGTHIFRVQAPLLPVGKAICLLGNVPQLGGWDTVQPILLEYDTNGWFSAAVDLTGAGVIIQYKYGVYDTAEAHFLYYEEGGNRELYTAAVGDRQVILHDAFVRINYPDWKGAGVAVPVFSLRSEEGLGTGEFADLPDLARWAQHNHLQLIQLLPVNDTINTGTWRDSYPYAAISSFALHPQYIRLQQVGRLPASHPLEQQFDILRQHLNEAEKIDYESMISFKLKYLKALYEAEGEKLQTRDYWHWFAANEHWLLPYAVFCYLRDTYDTCDYARWPLYNVYDYTAINRLIVKDAVAAEAAHFHFFVQYHLHLQLEAATEAVHSYGIALKGDLPIGISRYSVDAWMHPDLFHLDMQAGAPPDSFTTQGQNWGFPTYNWKKMADDGYSWWQQRLRHLAGYFDILRIDHILGFFRIWQIPMHAVQGLLGYFHPAVPVSKEELLQRGIAFDEERYCQPWITGALLEDVFGNYAEVIKDTYLLQADKDRYILQPAYNTQRRIRDLQLPEAMEAALFRLVAEVLLIKVELRGKALYHLRYDLISTASFAALDAVTQERLTSLYYDYFYARQESRWRKEALHKLPILKRASAMLICGEDIGMVPHCVPDVMKQLGILGLEIQRLPKTPGHNFADIKGAPYLSVLTPSNHDMSTLRGWWEEDEGL